jgi:hypothetical protein
LHHLKLHWACIAAECAFHAAGHNLFIYSSLPIITAQTKHKNNMQLLQPREFKKGDLTKIRKLLPYNWRQQIHQMHPAISERQITETFYLRTRNAEHAEIVFSTIYQMLQNLGKTDLAQLCQNRIQLCRTTQLKPAA